MTLTPLLPIGGAALGVLAGRTLAGISQGLAFGSLLAGNPSDGNQEVVSNHPSVSVNLDEALPQFISDLRERLQTAGIDFSHSFTLKEDGSGGVIVDGSHPDSSVIEGLLAHDPKLLASFQAIAAAASQRRQNDSLDHESAFAEFRLSFTQGVAAIHFE
jgi:hypothetical protein